LAHLLKTDPDETIHILVFDLRHKTASILASARLLDAESNSDLTIEQQKKVIHVIEQSATHILNILTALSSYDDFQRKKLDSAE